MITKVFIVEDDIDIRISLDQCLTREGYKCSIFHDGTSAIENLNGTLKSSNPIDYSVALLDLTLPDMDGLDILRFLKTNQRLSSIPTILLTARNEEIDRLIGLELGADDYLAKPYSSRELVLRIKSLLRRARPQIENKTYQLLSCPPFFIDEEKREVIVDNATFKDFTKKEFDLFLYLAQNQGRVLTREKILQSVWGLDYLGESRTIDAHIKRLRSKLENYGDRIESVIGVGYRLMK